MVRLRRHVARTRLRREWRVLPGSSAPSADDDVVYCRNIACAPGSAMMADVNLCADVRVSIRLLRHASVLQVGNT